MRHTTRIACALLLGSALGPGAAAQSGRGEQPPPKAATRAAKRAATPTPNQQSALQALEQLSESAKGFDDDLLKLRTQAHVADLLWPFDEARARAQFEEVFRSAVAARPRPEATAAPPSPLAFAQVSPLAELRGEVLSLVAQRDAGLAERLIKAFAEDSPEAGATPKAAAAGQTGGQELYLQASLGIAARDPERSARLAKLSLAGGVSPELLKILFTLKPASPAAADDLFRAALAAARHAGPSLGSANVSTLAPYALPEFVTLGVAGPAPHPGAAAQQAAAPLAVEFLHYAHDTFLQLSGVAAQLGLPGAAGRAVAPTPVDYMTGQRLLPFFARHAPDKAATFRQSLDAIARHLPPGAGAADKLFQPVAASELLEQAERERNVFMKDLLYTRAAMSSVAAGDFDQALSVVGKMDDAERRAGFDSILRFQAAAASIKKGDVDAALRYAKGVTDLRQRAFVYGMIARALLDKNEAARASEVLDEAARAVGRADDGTTKANALLLIAEVRSRLDAVQGFEALEASVKAFNRADSGERADTRAAAPGGVSVAAMTLSAVFKLDAPDFGPVFSRLARADFQRAVQLARALERKERSVSAQLAACRGALAGTREKATARAAGVGQSQH